MSPAPSLRLPLRLALASIASAASVAVVCGVGLVAQRDLAAMTRAAVSRQVAQLEDASAFQSLLYQRGFVAGYLLTHDPSRLRRLAASQEVADRWLALARANVGSDEKRALLDRIEAEYVEYKRFRQQVIDLASSGHDDEAKALLLSPNRDYVERMNVLMQEFGRRSREEAEATLGRGERSMRRLGALLVVTSVLGALASLAVGFFLARRIAKPIYELQLQIESAAQRGRIRFEPAEDGGADALEQLGPQLEAIVARLEQTDAALVEHRRRLIQSEKLSAMGELAAKLAHEILNPLAGMRAAVQLLLRSRMNSNDAAAAGGEAEPDEVRDTAEALDREIGRVDELVRRLVNYARPLAPQVEVCPIGRIFDQALEAVQLGRRGVAVERAEQPDLPPLEIDPLLMTQVMVNLLENAAQAQGGSGTIRLAARRGVDLGREHVVAEVADEGPGISPEHFARLFHPFFTTKSKGHGLGLAVSQNIVLEHGGRIAARNRDDGRGAAFEVWIPLVR